MERNNTKSPSKKFAALRLIKLVFQTYPLRMTIVFILVAIAAACTTVNTVFLEQLVDRVIVPGLKTGLESVKGEFFSVMALRLLAAIVSTLATLAYSLIMVRITQGIMQLVRDKMFAKMETLPISFFDRTKRGDIMSNFTNDTEATRELIEENIVNVCTTIVAVVVLMTVMMTFSFYLFSVVLMAFIAMVVVIKKVGGKSATGAKESQKRLAQSEGYIEEMVEGQKVVKAFAHEDEAIKNFEEYNHNHYLATFTAHGASNILMPILGNIGHILYVVIAIVGSLMLYFKVQNFSFRGFEPITIGIVMSFLGMSNQLSRQVGNAAMQMSSIAMGIAGAGRIFNFLDQESESDDGTVTITKIVKSKDGTTQEVPKDTKEAEWVWKIPQRGGYEYRPVKAEIHFTNVNFSYTPNKPVLFDITMYAKPGTKIALVGATGAGKTTITNLLNRFYDIDDGEITFDGIDIKQIRKKDLRHSLALVGQDVSLFTGTIMENIRYGRLSATDEECIKASKDAGADAFISKLPSGYQTQIGGLSSSLSQGQRQLISIARAAVSHFPALVLDEATSSIDTHTEKLVQSGMDRLMEGKSTFAIAHRLSTIRSSDCIMVMDKGRIIERGNHTELMDQKGVYYRLNKGTLELQ